MAQLQDLVEGITLEPVALLDIALTALLIYGLFSLIQGTRAVSLVIGAIVLYVIYVVAQVLDLRLLSGIMETGAVVGLLALVVVFQPELRRALERIGRVGSLGWVMAPSGGAAVTERVSRTIARAAAGLATARAGALIVIERETGLEDTAETGVMLHADLSEELLRSIFAPHAALHDGAVIVRGDRIIAAAALLPLSEAAATRERMGTRHRAALGISEQTDAIAVVVSEESGRITLVERGRALRDLDEDRLRATLAALLRRPDSRGRAAAGISAIGRTTFGAGKRPRIQRSRRPGRPDPGGATAAVPAAGGPVGAAAGSTGPAGDVSSAAVTPAVPPPAAPPPGSPTAAGRAE
jgi:diadenylate cyclase